MIDIKPGTRRDVTWVAANMRDHDRAEVLGVLHPHVSASQAGFFCFESSGPDFCWTAWLRDEPVAAFGAAPQSPLTPWLWSAWSFGTDKMRRAIPAISRFSLETWPRLLIGIGVHRLEVRSSVDHDVAHDWLTAMGCRREGVCTAYGRNGEDYELWAWLKKDFEHVCTSS